MPSTTRTEDLAWALISALLFTLLLAACERDRPAAPAPPETTRAPSAAPSTPARPSLSALPEGPWQEAMARDRLAVLRLATDRDVDELIAVAQSDAKEWPVALEALAEADDAEHVFEELATLAARDTERRGPALVALRAIASRRPESVEPRDPPGIAAGAQILDRISRDHELSRRQRALAISALRGLARSGRYDSSRIPTLADRSR